MISLLSKGLSRLIFSTTIQKHQFFYAQTSLWINSQIPFLITSLADYWKNHSLSIGSFVGNVIRLLFNKPSSSIVTFFPRSSPLAAVPFSSDCSIELQFPPPAATRRPRSGGCMDAGGPRVASLQSRSGGEAERRYPSSKVRSTGCALLEQP